MDIARISSKGQVTIPVEIRKKLGLKEGDKIIFLEKDNNVILINKIIEKFKDKIKPLWKWVHLLRSG